MQFSEEEAFWMLSALIETVIPMDYYTNMIGVVCDQQVFLAILSQIHPEITHKFNEVGLDPSVLSIEWFVCLFTSSLPIYVSHSDQARKDRVGSAAGGGFTSFYQDGNHHNGQIQIVDPQGD